MHSPSLSLVSGGPEGVVALLSRHPVLSGLGMHEIGETSRLWRRRSLKPGERLWGEGDVARSLALVIGGELTTDVGGHVVGRVGRDQLVGETCAFVPGALRSATVRAATGCWLLVLPVAALVGLRERRHPLYDALLTEGLRALARRIADADARVAQVGVGDQEQPARRDPRPLLRWVQRRRRPSVPCPEVAPQLRRHPGLADLADWQVASLCEGWEPVYLAAGEAACLEGEDADCAWVVASGQLNVLRNTRGRRARHLTRLGAGSLVGANALIAGGRRSASVVAATPCWLYRIPVSRFQAPEGAAGRVIKELIFATLTAQLRLANAALNGPPGPDAEPPGPTGVERQRLKAWGALEGIGCEETLAALGAIIVQAEEQAS